MLKPGDKIPDEMKNKLQAIYEKDASKKASSVQKVKERGHHNQLLIWCLIILILPQ